MGCIEGLRRNGKDRLIEKGWDLKDLPFRYRPDHELM